MGIFYTSSGFNTIPTLLVFATFILALLASINVKTTFNKYDKVKNDKGLTGFDVARQILDNNNLYDVQVVSTAGSLTDHFDPRTNTVALSQSVYGSTSVAALGVAAHEVGHAIQHAENYSFIKFRTAFFPLTQLGSHLWYIVFILGLVLEFTALIDLGIVLFALIVLFQLITLPVEFDASSRALNALSSYNILEGSDLKGSRKVLTAAALTYVAALASSVAQLIRMLSLRNRR